MKNFYTAMLFCLVLVSAQAQKKEAVELNCYNKWSVKFEERGADDVKDGIYTDVIITFRQGAKADCYNGKAEVFMGKVVRFFLVLDDGSYDEVKKVWKNDSNKDVEIINGISKTMITVHNELINVIWPSKLKAKKAAPKRAAEPADD
ncbi:MAG: hypothetical protein ACXVPQ_07525 [Bacteroidia bacterium]